MALEPLAKKGNYFHIYDFRVKPGKGDERIKLFDEFDYSDANPMHKSPAQVKDGVLTPVLVVEQDAPHRRHACSFSISAARAISRSALLSSNTWASFSSACFFWRPIRFGYTPCRLASSASVCSPRLARPMPTLRPPPRPGGSGQHDRQPAGAAARWRDRFRSPSGSGWKSCSPAAATAGRAGRPRCSPSRADAQDRPPGWPTTGPAYRDGRGART
jgi:hypothetical protein